MSELVESTGNTTGHVYYYQKLHGFNVCGLCGCIVDTDFIQIHTDWHDGGK